MTMMDMSEHSLTRAAQRNLGPEDVDYILAWGERHHCGGALIYFLRRCDIPASDRGVDRHERLAGTALIVSRDGTVITLWRNRRSGLKRIRCKSVYDRPPASRRASRMIGH
jgi:hypothetical protein